MLVFWRFSWAKLKPLLANHTIPTASIETKAITRENLKVEGRTDPVLFSIRRTHTKSKSQRTVHQTVTSLPIHWSGRLAEGKSRVRHAHLSLILDFSTHRAKLAEALPFLVGRWSVIQRHSSHFKQHHEERHHLTNNTSYQHPQATIKSTRQGHHVKQGHRAKPKTHAIKPEHCADEAVGGAGAARTSRAAL